jgi:hypothetical protein
MECGAMWQELAPCGPLNRACYSPDSFRRFLEGRLRQLRHFWGVSFRLDEGTADGTTGITSPLSPLLARV